MRAWLIAATLALPSTQPQPAPVRSVFLNGVDISSARSQELKNVDLVINEQGDVFITAPHYQVNEEDTYVPLSKFVQGASAPEHKPPQAVGAGIPPAGTDAHPASIGQLPKAGTPVDATGAPAGDAAAPADPAPAPAADGKAAVQPAIVAPGAPPAAAAPAADATPP
jgi:hypothetical protein